MGKRVLAVASGGGHWQQLQLLRSGFSHHDVLFLTTLPGLPEQVGALPAAIVPDCSRDEKRAIVACTLAIGLQILRHKPDVVISTGALPGLIALVLGRMARARTIWVDSVANAEEFSMSGRHARRFADLWLSQWEVVAEAAGAEYAGALL